MSGLSTRRKRIAGLAIGLCAIAAPLATIATPAAAAPVDVTGGTVSWGVKSSFQEYVQGPGSAGSVVASNGATYAGALGNPQPIVFPVSGGTTESPNASATSTGQVVFTGHGGILEVTFTDVRVNITGTTGTIVVDATSRPNGATPQPPVTYDDVTFATLDLSAVTPTTTSSSYVASNVPAVLTSAGVPILANFYAAGTALDPVSLDLTLQEPPPPPADKLTWKVSQNVWTSSSLSPLRAADSPAQFDSTNGFVLPATGTPTYNPATGAAHATFGGALKFGNVNQGGYQVRFANPEITIDANGTGTIKADPAYCLSASACTAGTWTVGNDITIVNFDVQDQNGTVTDTGSRYTLTLTPPWAATPASSFAQGLIDFLPASLRGHFRATGGATDNLKPADPFTVTFPYTPPTPAPTRAIADFDGNGTTDIAVFRPSNGGWFVDGAAVQYLGLSGDIPVPADYTDSGGSQRAVFRPSNGAWFVDGAAEATYHGLSGDIPVPGDYDGDGTVDQAVYRPSNGGWYLAGSGVTYLGLATDIPVPADYDGDGDTDLAVFRPSTGAWYVQGADPQYFGASGDVPVPADYDGDGAADLAVFRAGAWFIDGQATQYFGLASDTPVPGQYDADAATDVAVFRSSDGGWHIQDAAAARYYGLNGDIPAPRNPALSAS